MVGRVSRKSGIYYETRKMVQMCHIEIVGMGHMGKYTNEFVGRHRYVQERGRRRRQTGMQTGIHTDMQTDRQTDRQTYS